MKTVGGSLAADECEVKAIELARKLRRKKTTYREIAQILVANGFEARTGRPWSIGTLYNILNRRTVKTRARVAV